jgi:DMSO/TMAO reductase YedYZ molybdopterin-dependent catalytic subunit
VSDEGATAVRGLGGRYRSALHDERTAALLGVALGVSFTLCFATGLWSHLQQDPPAWFSAPSRPAGLYRVTQGIHVTSGFAAIPLLLAKLWVVHPRLVEWPPARSLLHAIERLALLPLVGGGVFLLFSGVANVARWYPWTFFFPRAHFWAAWITIGGLVVHVGAKAATTRRVLRRSPPSSTPTPAAADRRGFLAGVAAASTALVVTTAGGTIAPLGTVSVLAQRRPGDGPQGLPVNKSAASARVTEIARDPAFRLVIDGAVDHPLALSLAELRAMPAREATLPIACVEGWSQSATWRGVPLRDLLALAGARLETATVTVESLQPSGRYRASEISGDQLRDPDTLLALELGGEPLHIDHGFPTRLIGPNRPGVLQTKWVARLEVR